MTRGLKNVACFLFIGALSYRYENSHRAVDGLYIYIYIYIGVGFRQLRTPLLWGEATLDRLAFGPYLFPAQSPSIYVHPYLLAFFLIF